MATFQVVFVQRSSQRRQSQESGPASSSSGIHSEGRERTICTGRFVEEFPGCFPSFLKYKLILWKDWENTKPLDIPRCMQEFTCGHAAISSKVVAH